MTRIRYFGTVTAVIKDEPERVIELRVQRYDDTMGEAGIEDCKKWARQSLSGEIDRGYRLVEA